ncbi:MAG TPA: prolipoprotein diacylglyceryl transferase [Gammaproteobacteria bacterium]|nr:prolipoprotein diacylglyceryl transferase [Gammaproteobacteria bacterium]
MLTYPHIDPVAISLGPLTIHWYGLMYLLAFLLAWALSVQRAKKSATWQASEVTDLIFYGALGVILGGRLGYVLFYNFVNFIHEPLLILKIWQGGMSFHGGLLGVLIAMVLFAKKYHKTFFQVTDFIAPLVPIGLGLGRVGNFINGELWGRVSDVPWAMVFPGGGPLARHPSQLYQAFFEGVVLFLILWIYSSKPRPSMAVSGLFALCYGLFRILTECFREPDAHIGFILAHTTMGQWLSLPLVLVGILLLYFAYHKKG